MFFLYNSGNICTQKHVITLASYPGPFIAHEKGPGYEASDYLY